jgi:hypothetical protein
VPDHYLEQHAVLSEEWKNATRWPKHLLLDYRWREEHEVNAVPGMYVLFATGARPPSTSHVLSVARRHGNPACSMQMRVCLASPTACGSAAAWTAARPAD